MFLFLTTVTCGLIVLVSAHPNGARVEEACGNFETVHYPDNDKTKPPFQPQTLPAPYDIIASPTSVAPGGTIEVTIQGAAGNPNGDYFKGFLMQAVDQTDNNKIVGAFLQPGDDAKALSCPGGEPGNTVTHTKPTKKPSVTLTWKAPEDYVGAVVFRATIVKLYDVFWYEVRSKPVIVE